MQTRWPARCSISTGSVSEQIGGPDLLPTNPGTEAAVPDEEASPELSKAHRGRTRCQAMCHGCAGLAGKPCRQGGGFLGLLPAGQGMWGQARLWSIPSRLLRHCSAGICPPVHGCKFPGCLGRHYLKTVSLQLIMGLTEC